MSDSPETLRASLADFVRELPPAVVTLAVASMLPPESIPWPWLHEITDTHYPEARTQPGTWEHLRQRLTDTNFLIDTPIPHVASMPLEVANAVRPNILPADHVRLLTALRGIVDRRLKEFQALQKQMTGAVIKLANGGQEITGWTIPSADKVLTAARYNTYVQATDNGDRSFTLSLRKGALWEESCLHFFCAKQLASDDPDAIHWALRADLIRGESLLAEVDRITKLCATNPADRRWQIIQGLVHLSLSHNSAANASWPSAHSYAESAVKLFAQMNQSDPEDVENKGLLEEAQKYQQLYDD